MTPFDVPIGVQITRRIAAPRERVFDAFTVPELRKQWWGVHPGDQCTLCEIDARVGGRYRVNMISPSREFITTGTFLEVDRPDRLVFTWSWEVPAGPVEDSVVTIDLKLLAESLTELTLSHDLLPNDELSAMHAKGWNSSLDKLVQQIGASAGQPHADEAEIAGKD